MRSRLLLLAFLTPFLIMPEVLPVGLVLLAEGVSIIYLVYSLIKWSERNVVGLLLFLLLLASFPSTLRPSLTEAAGEEYAYFLLGLVLLVIVLKEGRDRGRVPISLLYFVIFVGFLLSNLGPFVTDFRVPEKFLSLNPFQYKLIETGQILDPNVLASVVAMVLPLAIAMIIGLAGRSRLTTWLLVGSTCWMGVVLLVTQSRGGWFAFCAAILFLLFANFSSLRRMGPLIAVLALSVLIWMGPLSTIRRLSGVGPIPTLDIRLDLWQRALTLLQTTPFRGIGPAQFTERIASYPAQLGFPDAFPVHSHNLFLQIALDFGVPALFLFLLLATFLIVLNLRHDSRNRVIYTGVIASILVFFLNGMVDSAVWLNKPHLLPFLFLGILSICAEQSHRGPLLLPVRSRGFLSPSLFIIGTLLLSVLLALLTEYQGTAGIVTTCLTASVCGYGLARYFE